MAEAELEPVQREQELASRALQVPQVQDSLRPVELAAMVLVAALPVVRLTVAELETALRE